MAIEAATPAPPLELGERGSDAARGERARARLSRISPALGSSALVGVLACAFLIAAGAAGGPTRYVPARSGGWHGWLAGPYSGLGLGLGPGEFQTLILVLTGSYLLALACARRLPGRAIAATVVGAHALLALGPPLISQDVFGYLAFARMGALHGLDPYTHFPSEAASDPVFPFLGWPFQHSPYGPLFTLASYAVAPLGIAGGLWVLKGLAAATSLAAVALIARAARLSGGSPRWAATFVGLNPVLLVLAVGGAHNDTLMLLAISLALVLGAISPRGVRGAAAAAASAVGVKVTAALLLPFMALSPRPAAERRAVAAVALLTLAAVAIAGLLAFGVHAGGFLGAVGEQQQLVASHSVPAETARWVGLSGTPGWWRHLYLAGFALVLLASLWRTARGGDWRVAVGWSTLALLLCTAWLLPWYAVWALPLAAVGGDRRLVVATLAFCAYALLIHLQLADAVLSPPRHFVHIRLPFPVPGAHHRLEFAGFELLRNVSVDLRW